MRNSSALAVRNVVQLMQCTTLSSIMMSTEHSSHKYVSIGTLDLFTHLGIKEMIIIFTQGCENLILAFLVGSALLQRGTHINDYVKLLSAFQLEIYDINN